MLKSKQTVTSMNAGCIEEQWTQKKRKSALRILFENNWLLSSLIYRDIRSRYKQSVLGIAWAILTPIAMTIVYTIVFGLIAKMDTEGLPPAVFYYVTMLSWGFFSQGITTGSECLVSNFNLITKIYFPREVFPIAAILGKSVDLGLGILVIIPLFLAYHINVGWRVLFVIPLLIIQTCFALGLTFILSSANLFYRDIRHIVPLLMTVWMYMVPIIYSLDKVPKRFLPIYMLDPMVPVVDAYRKVVIHNTMPMWNYLLVSAVISIVVLIIGYKIFKKLEPIFAETV